MGLRTFRNHLPGLLLVAALVAGAALNTVPDFDVLLLPLIGIPAVRRLGWFNHGFMRAQVQGSALVLSDLRMGLDRHYTFNFRVAEQRGDDWQAVAPQQIQVPLPISGVSGFKRLVTAVWHRTWHQGDVPLRDAIAAGQVQAAAANPDGTPASSASK